MRGCILEQSHRYKNELKKTYVVHSDVAQSRKSFVAANALVDEQKLFGKMVLAEVPAVVRFAGQVKLQTRRAFAAGRTLEDVYQVVVNRPACHGFVVFVGRLRLK